MPYRDLNPRTQLEQAVSADLSEALTKRGATVTHHGTAATHAPAVAPCDISVAYGTGSGRRSLMVEVAQRNDATEFQSIVSHLDAWINDRGGRVNLLYSGRSTSARMARLVRNENERRQFLGLSGRIIFLKFDDLEQYLHRWAALPAVEAPLSSLNTIFGRWAECIDDLSSADVFQQVIFPGWEAKSKSISVEKSLRLTVQQERLKKDIVKLENQLRERGITGQKAHKYLIYLFFMALYEDKRGMATRATRAGFLAYREALSNAARANEEFRNKTVHHLLSQDILADPDISRASIPSQYEAITLPDDFVLSKVIPVFEEYSFADASIDAIGAVFEALARRAEKDNRIGQFFTPETVVAATARLAGLKPTDLVADPACGTARFLIRAMAEMLSKATATGGMTKAQVEESIRERQLFGSDLDPWVSVIAKMNMYIYGDGKSNIKHANGLTISTVPVFQPSIQQPVVDMLDVVLMNPPLGDIDFTAVADQVARDEFAVGGVDPSEADLRTRAGVWSRGVFQVVPHKVKEAEERDNAARKQEEYLEKAVRANIEKDVGAERRARRRAEEWSEKRKEAERAIGAGEITPIAAGRTAKGGALFISSLVAALKPVRDASLPLEWRGGIIGMIIDESVLNGREYAEARRFIRDHFYVKAIVSLARDAFADLAKTTAKTSILILVKKDDFSVIQREPVFFGRAFKTGPNGRDFTRGNDLVPICDAYDRWRQAAIEICGSGGGALRQDQIAAASANMNNSTTKGLQIIVRQLDAGNKHERLDEAYWCMKDLIKAMPEHVPLGDLAEIVLSGRSPPDQPVYSFATASRIDVRVIPNRVTATTYGTSELRVINTGDILVSGIDLVNGAIGVVEEDCNGMIVSKEYFILRAKKGVDEYWLVSLLRTPAMRRIIEGTVTGTSNRTRVESPDVLMALRVPQKPKFESQTSIGNNLRKSFRHNKMMRKRIETAERLAAEASGLAIMDDVAEPSSVNDPSSPDLPTT